MMDKLAIRKLYDTLLNEMGPQGWWPADSKVEIILGAILVQNTNWRNVEKSVSYTHLTLPTKRIV